MEVKNRKPNSYNFSDNIDMHHKYPEKVSFWKFLYNSDTGEVLGRSASSWAKITIFYIIYYICLAAFFLACYKIFEKISINFDTPRWTQDDGLIGSNPGVGFRPMPDQETSTDSSLIWYNRAEDKNNFYWVKELNKFFDEMKQNLNNTLHCNFGNKNRPTKDKFCPIDATSNWECSRGNDGYGYFIGQPCVLIKLNKIVGFIPEPYTNETLHVANERGMPDYLQTMISQGTLKNDSTWVSCHGENPGDKETIGALEYYSPGEKFPFQGIPNYFYPYMNQPGYHTPYVWVKFLNPRLNTLIQIECKAWAYNIEADRITRQGSVHFELMID